MRCNVVKSRAISRLKASLILVAQVLLATPFAEIQLLEEVGAFVFVAWTVVLLHQLQPVLRREVGDELPAEV